MSSFASSRKSGTPPVAGRASLVSIMTTWYCSTLVTMVFRSAAISFASGAPLAGRPPAPLRSTRVMPIDALRSVEERRPTAVVASRNQATRSSPEVRRLGCSPAALERREAGDGGRVLLGGQLGPERGEVLAEEELVALDALEAPRGGGDHALAHLPPAAVAARRALRALPEAHDACVSRRRVSQNEQAAIAVELPQPVEHRLGGHPRGHAHLAPRATDGREARVHGSEAYGCVLRAAPRRP